MAARRVAKSVVDWAAFAEKVPPAQREYFRAFKVHSDKFLARVHQYPEALPKIDFGFYRSQLANPAMVDEFEKSYASIKVDYPKDTQNAHAEIDKEKVQADKSIAETIAKFEAIISDSKLVLGKISSIPKAEEMTLDMMPYYFPDVCWDVDDENKTTIFPHTDEWQGKNIPNVIN